jgi:very-short-patch-repair endonuclease
VRDNEKQSRAFAKRLRQSMTRAEALLWSYIRRRALNGARFRRQHPIGPYITDFACVAHRLIIEIDGHTHSTPEQLAHDARRTKYVEAEGWRLVRVTNADVYDDMNGVWFLIAAQLPPPAASQPPPPHAGEE